MESQYFVQENGQEVRIQDIASFSKNAALADDRVLWELFRLLPYDVAGPQKIVMPYGIEGWPKPASDNSTALVHPTPTGGSVRVRGFRAGVSSLTSSGALDKIRDMRTGQLAPTSDGFTVVTIAANASLNPRWTLVYATVTPDTDGDSESVLVKDTATQNVTAQTVVINKKTTIGLGTVNGTAAASPTRPAIPADAAGVYYIPLAYVLVPAGFGSLTVLDRRAIYEVAPVRAINSAMGVISSRPANQQWEEDGTVDTNQSGADAAVSTTRPGAYLPSTMVGGEERIILIQNALTPLSHNDEDVVDDSCDWRFRYFEWTATAEDNGTTADAFPSDRRVTGTNFVSSAWNSEIGVTVAFGVGQSFVDDTTKGAVFSVADGNGAACVIRGSMLTKIGGGSDYIMLYVRNTDGALVVRFSGTPDAQVKIRLRATAPYSNYGVLS